ncbi:MAG: glycosyltransferase family 39 protein [Candidatus Aegiribacteria sp.]|nr:glycosyltransferase family 39 protein [Candidatus Aegiribacteria sp.]
MRILGRQIEMRNVIWLIIGFILLAVFAVYSLSGYRTDGPLDKVIQLVVLFPAIICIAWSVSKRIRKDLSLRASHLLNGINVRTFLLLSALFMLIFTTWMAFYPLEGTAKGGDEAVYLFQGKVFAAGELSAPVPSVSDPERFFPSRHLIMESGKWFCQYPPIHSIFMVPFVWLDLTALLGPLEGVLSLIGLFMLVRLWTNDRMAKLTSILLLLSPFFLVMTSTHMAHNSNLMLVTWSLYFLSIFWKHDRFICTAVSGFLLGLALMAKPYPIIIWTIFLTIVLVSGGRKGFKALLGLALGSILPVAGFLALNWYYTGNALKTPYQLARAGRLIGFGPDKAWFPVYGDTDHTVWRGIKNGVRQIASGATTLFGWPLLSLVPLIASIGLIRRDRRILWLFLPLPAMFILLLPHAWPAVIYGPRHYYTFLPIILFLSVLGMQSILRAARARWGERGGSFFFLVLAGLFGITLFLYLPEEIRLKSGPWLSIDGKPWELAQEAVNGPAVVFMEASDRGYPNILSGMNYNSPFLDTEIIFCAHQTAEEDQEFMGAFPGREYYLYFVDETGSHFMERWNLELAEELLPSRIVHPDPTAIRNAETENQQE